MGATVVSNFSFLAPHDAQLVRLGSLAERYFPDDPNTCLLKLRQLAELLAKLVAARTGQYISSTEPQYDLVRRLQDQGVLPREIAQLFGEVRRSGNAAVHEVTGDHRGALAMLRFSWQLGIWYHRTFGDRAFKSGPFIPPARPKDESESLRAELSRLNALLEEHRAAQRAIDRRLKESESEREAAERDRMFWEQTASEAEVSKARMAEQLAQHEMAPMIAARGYDPFDDHAFEMPDMESAALAADQSAEARLAEKLAQLQGVAEQESAAAREASASAGKTAAAQLELDEADTRKLIDDQLRASGWEANSETLRYAAGSRPEKGRNRAIAEWPTASGPADYVLFVGLIPVATVEAKRKNVDVSGALVQAQRYSRGFEVGRGMSSPGEAWDEYRLPFVFSSNARPYLKQLSTKSGIWFRDVRRPINHGHPLDAWHTPEGLSALLKRDEAKADAGLKIEPFNYGFPLRPYQRSAIQAVESGIAKGQRAMLLAMATGTGKTKTCVALIYRLLKLQRFRRILFVVDRSALGEQAADAFNTTRMESLQRFSDVFGIKELEDASPDTDTKVHIATIQGMVQRVLNAPEAGPLPAIDAYDCIIVDECHRGYLLDRQLSDTELTFRGFDDYVSKYRRVLEYFDAFKIGLTATPALHTVDIFGTPIFTYSYREAVIDGFLVDHEPPIQITTELSSAGIVWAKGAQVQTYDPNTSQVQLFSAPDEIKLEIDDFNRKVITESFNRVVCEYLATELDPSSRRKTLIFCANDAHADLVVFLLKQAFRAKYGEVDDDAVVKITGSADKPLQLIRQYKNERTPNVAVTVDLLTTGIDVPEICNIVFLRRVNSRILFDQMLGRATRLCDELEKESFRIFDAVRLYEALGKLTAMQPVVVDPKLSFAQLTRELATLKGEKERELVLEQFIAKFQAKRRHLSQSAQDNFEALCGMTPAAFAQQLKGMTAEAVGAWFAKNPDLGEILDSKSLAQSKPILLSTHPDTLRTTTRGYANALKPEDYLKAFGEFIKQSGNRLPALTAVLTRPRELTRRQLKELRMALDNAGFAESSLNTAYRETTNQDIAAGIIGYIRQAALGDALIPYEERVDHALQRIFATRSWSAPQREWLRRLAEQTKANLVVDRDALDEPDLVFKREGGGFARLNKIFDGSLETVLNQFNEALWAPAA